LIVRLFSTEILKITVVIFYRCIGLSISMGSE
jgi:hypothetical protein